MVLDFLTKYFFFLPLAIVWVSCWIFLFLSLIAKIIVLIGVFDSDPQYRIIYIMALVIATPIVIWSFLND